MFVSGQFAQRAGEEAVRLVERFAVLRPFRRHQQLVRQGASQQRLCLLRRGYVRLTLCHEDGREMIVGVCSAGDSFGESSLFMQEATQPYTATASEDGEMLVLDRRGWDRCHQVAPDFSRAMLNVMGNRVGELEQRACTFALCSVRERLMLLLSSLAEEEAEHWQVSRRYTHRELASMIGASREMVSRTLSQLDDEGVVKLVDRRYVLSR